MLLSDICVVNSTKMKCGPFYASVVAVLVIYFSGSFVKPNDEAVSSGSDSHNEKSSDTVHPKQKRDFKPPDPKLVPLPLTTPAKVQITTPSAITINGSSNSR